MAATLYVLQIKHSNKLNRIKNYRGQRPILKRDVLDYALKNERSWSCTKPLLATTVRESLVNG